MKRIEIKDLVQLAASKELKLCSFSMPHNKGGQTLFFLKTRKKNLLNYGWSMDREETLEFLKEYNGHNQT